MITAAVAEVERKRLWPSILKAVVGIASAFIPGGSLLGALTADAEKAGGAAPPPPPPPPEETHPKFYYDKVWEVRRRRLELVGGAGGQVSKDTLTELLRQLDLQEAAYLSAFTGGRDVQLWPAQFIVVPEGHGGKTDTTLLTFHPRRIELHAGAAPLSQPPSSWTTDPTDDEAAQLVAKSKQTSQLVLTTQKTSPDIVGVVGRLKKLKDPDPNGRSFHYRVPGQGALSLTQSTVPTEGEASQVLSWASEVTPVAQFGMVLSLPRLEVDKKTKYDLEWHAALGSLKKVGITDESHGAEDDGSAKAIQGLLGSRPAPEDEQTKLKREADMLELEVKKYDEQVKLDARLAGDVAVEDILSS